MKRISSIQYLLTLFCAIATLGYSSYSFGQTQLEENIPTEEWNEGISSLLDRAKSTLPEGSSILFHWKPGAPLTLNAEELESLQKRKLFILIPREESPYDIRVRVSNGGSGPNFKELQIYANHHEDLSLWWTNVHYTNPERDDYFLSLTLNRFETSAQGQIVNGTGLLNWKQNTEFRLISLTAPKNVSLPAFSLVLEDEFLVTVATEYRSDEYIPTVRPSITFRPLKLGVSMRGGKKTRYKVSVGAGYSLTSSPLETPYYTPEGYLRLQVRFR